MMTMLNRIMYMGHVEQDVKNFQARANKLGISFKIFHTTHKMVFLKLLIICYVFLIYFSACRSRSERLF